MFRITVLLPAFCWLVFLSSLGFTQSTGSLTLTAIKERDEGDVAGLQHLVDSALAYAHQRNTAAAYQQVAQFDLWLYEAASQASDRSVIKHATDAGIDAAQIAVSLDPKSSEAHRLLGDLLGRLIPQTFAGGLRYGTRSGREIQQAIALDPKNSEAYIARGVGSLFTPRAFSGSREEAIADLQKALAVDPTSDTAHLWLAQVYKQEGKSGEAHQEINAALALDPNRGFSKWIYAQLTSKKER